MIAADQLLSPWTPSASEPFDLARAGHLLRRAAFGASLAERRAACRRGVEKTLAGLFVPGPGEDVDAGFDEVQALAKTDMLRAYRFWRMLRGRRRLQERMSLFWHEHFATSDEKVRSARMMARQQRCFDEHGLGHFDELMLAVSRDPAMVRWLDNEANLKGKANENFARELFELFCLGRGAYSEADIKEAARAFTGWHLRHESFRFIRAAHDDQPKQIFGQRGRFTGEDVVRLTVARPESARFICKKLLADFVHPEPEAAEVDALAKVYTEHKRDIGATLRVLLRSKLFFSERAYRSRILSPVALCVTLVRQLGCRVAPLPLSKAANGMGQTLLEPPSVEGWKGERAWINQATWLLRNNFASRLFGGAFKCRPGMESLLAGCTTPAARADRCIEILLDGALDQASRARLHRFAASPAAQGPAGAAALFHAVQALPEGQLL